MMLKLKYSVMRLCYRHRWPTFESQTIWSPANDKTFAPTLQEANARTEAFGDILDWWKARLSLSMCYDAVFLSTWQDICHAGHGLPRGRTCSGWRRY